MAETTKQEAIDILNGLIDGDTRCTLGKMLNKILICIESGKGKEKAINDIKSMADGDFEDGFGMLLGQILSYVGSMKSSKEKITTRKAGKRVGSCVYVHKLYEDQAIPAKILKAAKRHLRYKNRGYSYDCVKWDKETNNITFQWSSTFDYWDEPIVDICYLVKADGTSRILPEKKDPQIWHHKWMWVKDDYSGFDVEKSKLHSELWKDKVTKEERRKIGYKSFWDSICHRWA